MGAAASTGSSSSSYVARIDWLPTTRILRSVTIDDAARKT
jgi:hypothetical protein